MHIGLVSPIWPADANGISTYVHNMRAELINQGHRVSVFCNLLGDPNTDADIHLVEPSLWYRIQRKLSKNEVPNSFNLLNWGNLLGAKVNDVHRRYPLDVVETDEFWGWCAVIQAFVATPVLVKLHGPACLVLLEEERQSARSKWRIDREGEGLRRMPALIAPTQVTLTGTVQHYGLTPHLQRVIANPLSLPRTDELWELDACNRKTLVFIGRFDKAKGGDTMLLAFRKLLEVDDSLRLIFVGPDSGLMLGDGLPIRFRQFVDSLFTAQQREQITYLGKLRPDELPNIRRKGMVTIVASRWESQGYTALEAMAQACPVVAVNTGGLGETIEDKVTGLLAGLGDIEDLCSKIMSILANPAEAMRLGTNARNIVLDRHSVPKLVGQTLDVYRQTIAMHRRLKTGTR